ncbi:TPA: amino acid permease, partial [Acinetobacter baumannii]|nr:amino acid permease [Acinetobacter baumannii]
NKRGVPVWGVLTSTLVGYGCVVIAALWPDTAFQFLLDSSGALFLFIYLMICLSQLKLRKKWVQEGTLTFKMWLHPWLPLFVTLCIVAVLVSMGINPATRLSLLQSLIAIFVIVIAYGAMKIVSPNKASHVPQVNPLRHTK